MEKKYKHFLITRFNLSNKWSEDHKGDTVLNDDWLKDRFQLFENYCFPSVNNQTNKNFEWWVYFDSRIDERYKIKIQEFMRLCLNFKPKYKKTFQDFQNSMHIDLYDEIKDDELDYIITTRLDNDDIIADDTIEILQKTGINEKCLLEIPIGFNLKVGSTNSLKKMHYELNHFISLIEPLENVDKIETVYEHKHGEWAYLKSIVVSEKPQWIQLIHDKNVYNQEKGEQIITYGALKRFTFNKPKFKNKENLRLIKKWFKKKIKSLFYFSNNT